MKVKKILTFAFAAVLMTSMTSCGNEDGPGGDGGGNGGGTVVVSGTPEQVADCPQSYTGKFLAPLLRRDRERQAQLDVQ